MHYKTGKWSSAASKMNNKSDSTNDIWKINAFYKNSAVIHDQVRILCPHIKPNLQKFESQRHFAFPPFNC